MAVSNEAGLWPQDWSQFYPEVHLIFPSEPLAVREALKNAIAGLSHLDLTSDETGTIELVLAEAMNNIVEHAYADVADGVIELQISHGLDGLTCQITDEGAPMPGGRPPIGPLVSNDGPLESLPEGGFGWFMIGELAKDVTYQREGGRNTLSFRIAVGKPLRTS